VLLFEIEWRGNHRYPLSTRCLGSILQVLPSTPCYERAPQDVHRLRKFNTTAMRRFVATKKTVEGAAVGGALRFESSRRLQAEASKRLRGLDEMRVTGERFAALLRLLTRAVQYGLPKHDPSGVATRAALPTDHQCTFRNLRVTS
jgi:hypothetical protein